jgi:multidrug efflux pump subunit AcrA (membrane-fusion protein)
VLSADSARLATACPTSATPTPDQQASCAAIQSQIVRDQADLASAQAQLTATQSAAKVEQQKDASALAASQATLSAAQNRANQAAPPVTPATIAQIQSDLANAQARVATDQQLLREDTITAPADGIVADTAGAAGDVVGPNGVHGFNGPAAESGTLSAQQASGFQLFVQPAAPNGGSTQQSPFAPVIVLFAPPMTVTAQLPEENMGGTHVGEGVTLDVTALGQTVHGTVSQILLDPARVPAATFYDVVIAMNEPPPPQLLVGMTVQVSLN